MKEEFKNGIFSHIEDKGNAEPFKVHSIDELMNMMMTIGKHKNSLAEMLMEINMILNSIEEKYKDATL
jgi:hypothetical protein